MSFLLSASEINAKIDLGHLGSAAITVYRGREREGRKKVSEMEII